MASRLLDFELLHVALPCLVISLDKIGKEFFERVLVPVCSEVDSVFTELNLFFLPEWLFIISW